MASLGMWSDARRPAGATPSPVVGPPPLLAGPGARPPEKRPAILKPHRRGPAALVAGRRKEGRVDAPPPHAHPLETEGRELRLEGGGGDEGERHVRAVQAQPEDRHRPGEPAERVVQHVVVEVGMPRREQARARATRPCRGGEPAPVWDRHMHHVRRERVQHRAARTRDAAAHDITVELGGVLLLVAEGGHDEIHRRDRDDLVGGDDVIGGRVLAARRHAREHAHLRALPLELPDDAAAGYGDAVMTEEAAHMHMHECTREHEAGEWKLAPRAAGRGRWRAFEHFGRRSKAASRALTCSSRWRCAARWRRSQSCPRNRLV